MRYYAFTQIALKEATKPHLFVHRVRMHDYNEKGWYRTITSLNAFCHGMKKRCWSPLYLYHGRPWDDFKASDDCTRQFMVDNKIALTETPLVEHNSLWDFYKYIGYDHKKNKYKETVHADVHV